MYSTLNIAKYIVNEYIKKDTPITRIQLQDILYTLQSRYIKAFGHPLFPYAFEMNKNGPYIPDIYYTFGNYGMMPITHSSMTIVPSLQDKNFIDNILQEIPVKPCEETEAIFNQTTRKVF